MDTERTSPVTAYPLAPDEIIRRGDRDRVARARHGRRRTRLLWLLIGPGVLTMVGENDGPSMISYGATGQAFGFGLFLPFIILTFAAAAVCQEMCTRVGAFTRRGYGELVVARYGPMWGWFAAGDLAITNMVTLVAEFVAIRIGFAYFGIGAPVAVLLGGGLVVISLVGFRYRRWERAALGLAAGNIVFIVAAVVARPHVGQLLGSFATTSPLGGNLSQVLLLVASTFGATVTPWMIFFQQSAVVDKGLLPADLGQGRLDVAIGTAVAALCGVGAYVAGAASGRSPTPGLVGSIGQAVRPIFALGLIEAGALAILTVSASSSYAIGECLGMVHSFNAPARGAKSFYAVNVVGPLIAGAVVLVPGIPLLVVALDANALAAVLLPVTLVFLLLLANDRDLMGRGANGRLSNVVTVTVAVVVSASGAAWAINAFWDAIRAAGR